MNGIGYTKSFSTVMQAMRNPALDSLQTVHPRGIVPLDSEASKARLKFGAYEARVKTACGDAVLKRPGFVAEGDKFEPKL